MGFCMETTGMTQGGQGETPSHLEMVAGSLEEPEFEDKTESMDDGRDPEVWNSAVLTTSVYFITVFCACNL